MNMIAHLVGVQCSAYFLDYFPLLGNLCKCQRTRTVTKSVEVVIQTEDPSIVKTQPLPHRIPTLNHGIKWAYPGFVAMQQLAIDVDD
jgi:hypothetical protein